jgi:hypothetical protein
MPPRAASRRSDCLAPGPQRSGSPRRYRRRVPSSRTRSARAGCRGGTGARRDRRARRAGRDRPLARKTALGLLQHLLGRGELALQLGDERRPTASRRLPRANTLTEFLECHAATRAAARLDALLLLGETERLEEEEAPFLDEQGYTRPFALRALGISRGHRSLVDEAAARFEAMGLGWRAVETRALAGGATMR